jgi:hypothetical protein
VRYEERQAGDPAALTTAPRRGAERGPLGDPRAVDHVVVGSVQHRERHRQDAPGEAVAPQRRTVGIKCGKRELQQLRGVEQLGGRAHPAQKPRQVIGSRGTRNPGDVLRGIRAGDHDAKRPAAASHRQAGADLIGEQAAQAVPDERIRNG